MSNNANNNATVSPAPTFGDAERRIIVSRLGGVYASPVVSEVKAGDTAVSLTCLPMAVLKADNIRTKEGARVDTAQCQWALTARVTFGGDKGTEAATTFASKCRETQGKGDAALCVLTSEGSTVTVFYGVTTVGVSPAGGRRAFAVGIAACLPASVNAADVDAIRDGITGEATTRKGPDVTGKVNAAVSAAMTAAIAGMVSAGINPEAAPYLARGEPLPAGIPMMAVKPTTTGRK